jgi:hypothetical protein
LRVTVGTSTEVVRDVGVGGDTLLETKRSTTGVVDCENVLVAGFRLVTQGSLLR